MKNYQFLLLTVVLFCASCSEPDGKEQVDYKITSIHITSDPEKFEGGRGVLEGFYLITAFNATEECLLSDETFASIEMYSDNELKFVDGYSGPDGIPQVLHDGVLHMTREKIYLSNFEPWNPANRNPEYDYYQELPVSAASGEGVYVFALKFYQPKSGKYYITPAYRMKVWVEDGRPWVRTETTLATITN